MLFIFLKANFGEYYLGSVIKLNIGLALKMEIWISVFNWDMVNSEAEHWGETAYFFGHPSRKNSKYAWSYIKQIRENIDFKEKSGN